MYKQCRFVNAHIQKKNEQTQIHLISNPQEKNGNGNTEEIRLKNDNMQYTDDTLFPFPDDPLLIQLQDF